MEERPVVQPVPEGGFRGQHSEERQAGHDDEVAQADGPELWDEVNKLRRRVTDPYLKDIMWAHIKKAKSGDVQAIKLFYEFRGELIQKHENLYPDGIPNNITLTIEDASLDDDEPDA